MDLPAILALNKIDLLEKKETLMEKIQAFSEAYEFAHILPLSASTGEGVEKLKEILIESAQPGPHFFPDDALTDQPERVIVAEITGKRFSTICLRKFPTAQRFLLNL